MRLGDWALALPLLLTGCASAPAAQLDSSTFPVQPNVPASPAAPALPALPVLTPCPAGWAETAGPLVGDAITCEPWPTGAALTCAADSAHFPGLPGCRVIGTACPAGEWADDLPSPSSILYVRAGGVNGSGTRAAPFSSVTAALAAASPGTIVALSKGTFNETVRLATGITLWGACVAQTHLSSSTAGGEPEVDVVGAGNTVRNLHVGGSRAGIYVVQPGAAVELREVVIAGAQSVGLLARNLVKVTGTFVVIRGTQPRAGLNDLGQGLEAASGAQVALQWVAIEGNRTAGVLAYGLNTQVTLTDAAIRDTAAELKSGKYGDGLQIHTSGHFAGLRIAIERNQSSGVTVQAGGQVSLADAVLREAVLSALPLESGFGAILYGGARLDLRRVLVDRNRAAGVLLDEPNTALMLSDVVVRETRGQAENNRGGGIGVFLRGGASVTGVRLALERNRRAGFSAEGAATQASLEDLTESSTQAQTTDGFFGEGLNASSGATVTVSRAQLAGNRCAGILAAGTGTNLSLLDVTVRGTDACLNDGLGGYGLAVQLAATATGSRIALDHNRSAAVLATDPGTSLALTDLQATDTAVEEGRGTNVGRHGVGLASQYGAQVQLLRARFERNHEVGIFASGGGRVTGTHVVVRATLQSDCLPPQCQGRAGIGAAALEKGSLVLSVFSITDNAQLGVELAKEGTADLESGEIASNPIGVNVQTSGFDLSRIQRDVVFRNNAQTLNAEALPLPELLQTVR